MISQSHIAQLIESKLKEDDVFVVDLKVSPSNEIVVHIDSNEGVNIRYCVEISRLIEGSLDRDEEDFKLEVSSPGIGPFKVWQQYKKYEGKEVLVKAAEAKPQKGILSNVTETGFTLTYSEKVKVEGKKKKIEKTTELTYNIADIVSAEPIISFK